MVPDPGHHLQPDRVPPAAHRLASSARPQCGPLTSRCCAKATSSPGQHHARGRRGVQRHPLADLPAHARHRLRLLHGLAPWVRVCDRLSTIPVAIVANGLRVAGTGIAAHYYGPEAAPGLLPHVSGLARVSRGVRAAVRRATSVHAPPREPGPRQTRPRSAPRRTDDDCERSSWCMLPAGHGVVLDDGADGRGVPARRTDLESLSD